MTVELFYETVFTPGERAELTHVRARRGGDLEIEITFRETVILLPGVSYMFRAFIQDGRIGGRIRSIRTIMKDEMDTWHLKPQVFPLP